jgi:multimeric flavodoxin WrbA
MAESLGADAGAGLKALGVNCTLKKSPEKSHTEALMNRVLGILAEHGVERGVSIWFRVRSSVCQMVIERLDGTYNERNEVGQYPLYNKVAGVVVTGNEDGAHASAETTLST